jgi:hypothetical protein
MAWLTRLVAALAIAASSSRFVATALPQGYSDPDAFLAGNGSADPFTDFPAVLKTRQNDKVQLRILPLGASIMSGQGSPEHSGYVLLEARDLSPESSHQPTAFGNG